MRQYIAGLLFFLSTLSLFAQHGNTHYHNYINNYYKTALKQQSKHNIPASIILAQGLLESGAGRSELATKANNHFGIKCHDWTGKKVYHDDDRKNECFRKYGHAQESFEDHSAFLVNRSRYASLFALSPTDYKKWAHGLKAAGYATDPTYAYKLISIIEEYELHRFDLMATNEVDNRGGSSSGKVSAHAVHPVIKINSTKYIVARHGDTYRSVADELNTKVDKLLAYNEMPANAQLKPGERVFIQKKKKKAARGFDTHVIQPGESLYAIAQYYGIRLVEIYKMNNLPYSQQAQPGMIIRLRPVK